MFMIVCFYVFFFKQKTAYEMRISDWSSDVCSSDLIGHVSPAALSQTVKMKSKRGAPGCENSSQLFERRPAVSNPSSSRRESACGWTSPLGKLPALKARKHPSPSRFSSASAKIERALFPVHRNSTL